MSSTNDYVYISFADNFPVNLYSVAISVIYTNNDAMYPNHVLIASSDPTKVKDMVKSMVNISPPNTAPLLKIELPTSAYCCQDSKHRNPLRAWFRCDNRPINPECRAK